MSEINNTFIAVITDETATDGLSSSFYNKQNLYCYETFDKFLKFNLQKYYNISEDNFFKYNQIDDIPESKANLPILLISQDCFDITKKIIDDMFEEYKSSGNIKVYDRENKKIIAKIYNSDNPDYKNYTADYIPVENLKELREKNQQAQKDIIEKWENEGVQFVSTDGVGISPFAEISCGAVIYSGKIIRGKSKIGSGTILGPNTIIDDSIIGENCIINSTQIYSSTLENNIKIGPFCHIRPNCVIKSGVRLGDFVEVKNSNIGEDTKAGHLTYIGDSDVGERVNFGCGTITANYDGIIKARCKIGNDAFIGCNTSLVATPNGIEVGDGGYTAAGSTITKNVPADSLAISRAREQKVIEHWVSGRKKTKE